MKHGYTCQCGWHLDRGNLTRRVYAATKEAHAFREGSTVTAEGHVAGCVHLRKELEQSRKAQAS